MSNPSDPGLYFAEDGNPRSERFGDIYYSLQDGLSETRAVFLAGCHMPDIWAGRSRLNVAELGFGTGLNIAALIQMWAEHRPSGGTLHIFSIEAFLMTREEAAKALSAWPELSVFAHAILGQWPKARHGFHHMDFPQWGINLTLALMDVREALHQWSGKADAWFLDGFSPALNPDMWADDVMALIGDRSHPGTKLATFTVAGGVRRGLSAVGFVPEKQPGFGKKRERLEAVFKPAEVMAAHVMGRPKIAVLGAGIAGCSIAYALRALGFEFDIIDPSGVGGGASGNRAALVTTRFDAGGGAISQLFADAHAYAAGFYRRLCPDAIIGEGVDQIAMTERDTVRLAKVQPQAYFPEEALELTSQGLRHHAAISVEPLPILRALVGDQRVLSALPETPYDHIFIATGGGVFDNDIATRLDLRSVRGQMEVARSDIKPDMAQAWGGYLVPVKEGFVFGATHDRYDLGTEVRDADRLSNIANLAKRLPELATAIVPDDLTSRAAVRVTTRDNLPIAATLVQGQHILTGLGGRGFCLAPLLARDLVAQVFGHPRPLMANTQPLVDVTRLWRKVSS